MKNKPIHLLLGLLLIAFGCKELTVEKNLDIEDVYVFHDFNDLMNKIHPTDQNSTAEMRSDQITGLADSWGKKADEIYDLLISKLENSSISSESELEDYISQNSEFIETVVGDDGEPVVRFTIEDKIRYFINLDRYLEMGDKVYKVYVNGMMEVTTGNADNLPTGIIYPNSGDEGFLAKTGSTQTISDSNARVVIADPYVECGDRKGDTQTNDNQRTHVFVETKFQNGNNNQVAVSVEYNIKALKKAFGSWVLVKRTMKGAWAVGLDYEDASGWRVESTYDGIIGEEDKHYNRTIIALIYYWYGTGNPGYHLSSVYAWAKTPSTGYAETKCDELWVCSVEYCYPWY